MHLWEKKGNDFPTPFLFMIVLHFLSFSYRITLKSCTERREVECFHQKMVCGNHFSRRKKNSISCIMESIAFESLFYEAFCVPHYSILNFQRNFVYLLSLSQMDSPFRIVVPTFESTKNYKFFEQFFESFYTVRKLSLSNTFELCFKRNWTNYARE